MQEHPPIDIERVNAESELRRSNAEYARLQRSATPRRLTSPTPS